MGTGGLGLQWELRFKRSVCHKEKTSLKYDFLVNRFQTVSYEEHFSRNNWEGGVRNIP